MTSLFRGLTHSKVAATGLHYNARQMKAPISGQCLAAADLDLRLVAVTVEGMLIINRCILGRKCGCERAGEHMRAASRLSTFFAYGVPPAIPVCLSPDVFTCLCFSLL